MTQLIIVICSGLVSSLFLFLSKKQPIISNKEDEYELSFFKGYKVIGIIGIYMAPVFAILEYVFQKKVEFVGWIILWAIFGFIFGWFYLTIQNTKIIVTSEGLTYITGLKKQVTMKWTDIKRVKISPATSSLVFISDNNKIKASFYLIGFIPILIAKTIEHLNPDIYPKRVTQIYKRGGFI